MSRYLVDLASPLARSLSPRPLLRTLHSLPRLLWLHPCRLLLNQITGVRSSYTVPRQREILEKTRFGRRPSCLLSISPLVAVRFRAADSGGRSEQTAGKGEARGIEGVRWARWTYAAPARAPTPRISPPRNGMWKAGSNRLHTLALSRPLFTLCNCIFSLACCLVRG